MDVQRLAKTEKEASEDGGRRMCKRRGEQVANLRSFVEKV